MFDASGRVNTVDHGMEDRNLAARAARGEAPAFSRLIHKHSDLVYRVSLRMLGANDAPDASQEAWVRAWRNIGSFRGESAFSTWMYRITMNTCLNT
ncbi:MAG: sigma-70 family RNA polymerase sigma factor, partial [Rubrobacteraceae bacterium]